MSGQKTVRILPQGDDIVDEIIEEESIFKAIGNQTQRSKRYHFQIDTFDGKITLERKVAVPEDQQAFSLGLIADPSI